MGSFSNYLENELLDHLFGCSTRDFSSPANIFIALSTADPTEDGSGLAEPSGNGYARKSTAGTDWNASSGGSVDNSGELSFPEATGAWGTLTHFALFDAASGGNMLAHGSLSQSKAIENGDTAIFGAGSLTASLD